MSAGKWQKQHITLGFEVEHAKGKQPLLLLKLTKFQARPDADWLYHVRPFFNDATPDHEALGKMLDNLINDLSIARQDIHKAVIHKILDDRERPGQDGV